MQQCMRLTMLLFIPGQARPDICIEFLSCNQVHSGPVPASSRIEATTDDAQALVPSLELIIAIPRMLLLDSMQRSTCGSLCYYCMIGG